MMDWWDSCVSDKQQLDHGTGTLRHVDFDRCVVLYGINSAFGRNSRRQVRSTVSLFAYKNKRK